MTPAQQRRFYFPAWQRALRACWSKEGGLILPTIDQPSPRSPDLPSARRVEEIAVAQARGRALTVDDLRHACHILALGRDVSSSDLTARQCDRVVVLFRLLADPDDLDAVNLWLHPDGADRKRMIWAVEHCGLTEAYVARIAESRHFTSDWRKLATPQLREFVMTCKARAASQAKKRAEVARIYSNAAEPADCQPVEA